MTLKIIGIVAFAATLAAGSALAAEMSQPTQATPSLPAASPAPAPAAAIPATSAPAPTAAMPATSVPAAAAVGATTQPTAKAEPKPEKMTKRHVSACTKAIQASEHALKMSKAAPDVISAAWQHIEAAEQYRTMKHGSDCKSEANKAATML